MSAHRIYVARTDGFCRLVLAEQLGDTLHLRFDSGFEFQTGPGPGPVQTIHEYRLDPAQTELFLTQLRRDFGPSATLGSVLRTAFESRRFDDRLHDYLDYYGIGHEFRQEAGADP